MTSGRRRRSVATSAGRAVPHAAQVAETARTVSDGSHPRQSQEVSMPDPSNTDPRVPWSAVLPLLLLAVLGLVIAVELTLFATLAGGVLQTAAFVLATVALLAVLALLVRARTLSGG